MFTQIQASVKAQGLLIRAAFHVNPADQVPALNNGDPAGTLILIGNAGSAIWPEFTRSAEYRDAQPDALDRWSLRLGNRLAQQFSGVALFPFGGAPYHPFLRWAKRGDASVTSPLGLSLHPEYGLWHAYRFGLVLPQRLEGLPTLPHSAANDTPLNACQRCVDKPCLSACPVAAFSGTDYQPGRCAQFLAQTPDYRCNQLGCGSRRACPVGQRYRYQPEHAQFHMRVFVALHAEEL